MRPRFAVPRDSERARRMLLLEDIRSPTLKISRDIAYCLALLLVNLTPCEPFENLKRDVDLFVIKRHESFGHTVTLYTRPRCSVTLRRIYPPRIGKLTAPDDAGTAIGTYPATLLPLGLRAPRVVPYGDGLVALRDR